MQCDVRDRQSLGRSGRIPTVIRETAGYGRMDNRDNLCKIKDYNKADTL